MSLISITVSRATWEELQNTINKIEEPHEHCDGRNECSICDEPLIDAAIRNLKRLEVVNPKYV
jgi:hypothetical protein